MTSLKCWKARIICQPRALCPEGMCHIPENKMFSLLSLGISELNEVKQVSVLHEFLVNRAVLRGYRTS